MRVTNNTWMVCIRTERRRSWILDRENRYRILYASNRRCMWDRVGSESHMQRVRAHEDRTIRAELETSMHLSCVCVC